jgi:hypothetical protein
MAENHNNDFRLSNGPVVRAKSEPIRPLDFPELSDLPLIRDEPFLFAIARDPRTIFAYWNIDWGSIFEQTAPVDRQVHLRVHQDGGDADADVAAEPMAGNCYLTISEPRGAYRVEIGYYQPKDEWNSVATSEVVTMPPKDLSDNFRADVATIPFHLSFQRLIDLFRASNRDALTEIVSRLQKNAVSDEDRALLTDEEWEILRAMNVSLEDIAARRRFEARPNEPALRKRAESILGFGASSPSRAFGESSWS